MQNNDSTTPDDVQAQEQAQTQDTSVDSTAASSASDTTRGFDFESVIELMGDEFGEIVEMVVRGLEFATTAERIAIEFRDAYPQQNDAIWGSFLSLQPAPDMDEMPMMLYEAHCRELLTRVVERRDLADITQAETLFLLSRASLRAPLNHEAFLLYVRLFEALFPDQAHVIREGFKELPPEPHVGAVDQLQQLIQTNFRRKVKRAQAKVQPKANATARTRRKRKGGDATAVGSESEDKG